ncbi:hst3 protein, variant 2 [Coprinopsis cinerea AmutBmut pab1-1]|nr:hst3 protein, variant 2 [Coprinopsis cinerea AmutBmut pab1-1]
MMAQLADLSQNAEPTSFHHFLRALNDHGRLLRVYTQNIDAIEQKCGLSFGVPQYDAKKWRPRTKAKPTKDIEPGTSSHVDDGSSDDIPSLPPNPAPETPRCIPLHGTLQEMYCQACRRSFPLQDHLPSLSAGQPPDCPECTNLEKARAMSGKRLRGIGRLRPSVVLYNEAHHDGESVGDVVQKDLIGSSKGKGKSGADLLLVVGTSLKVPGTKRMVREFAKAVKSRGVGNPSSAREENAHATSSWSSRQSPASEEEPPPAPIKAIYLNLDFPVPTREWEGVFDAWVQGDAQTFAEMMREEIRKDAMMKEQALEKKRRKEEAFAAAEATQGGECVDFEMRPLDSERPYLPTPQPSPKRKSGGKSTPSKKQKTKLSACVSEISGSTSSPPSSSPSRSSLLPEPPRTPPRRTSISSSSCFTRHHDHSPNPQLFTPERTPTQSQHRSLMNAGHGYRFGESGHALADDMGLDSTTNATQSPSTTHHKVSDCLRDRLAHNGCAGNPNPHATSCRPTMYLTFCGPVQVSSMRSTLLPSERVTTPQLVDCRYDGFGGDG